MNKFFSFIVIVNVFVASVFCGKLPGDTKIGEMGEGESPLPQVDQVGQVGQQVGGLTQGLGLPGLGGLPGKGKGQGAGSCTCADKMEPVCASNGKTYDNECKFKCEMKMENTNKSKRSKGVKITKRGKCAEQKSKPAKA